MKKKVLIYQQFGIVGAEHVMETIGKNLGKAKI